MGVVIEVAKKEEQIKNRSHSSYFKKWADLQVTLSNWLSHPDITLNKILGNNFHLNEQPILNRAEILMLEYSHTAFYSEYVKKFNNLNPVGKKTLGKNLIELFTIEHLKANSFNCKDYSFFQIGEKMISKDLLLSVFHESKTYTENQIDIHDTACIAYAIAIRRFKILLDLLNEDDWNIQFLKPMYIRLRLPELDQFIDVLRNFEFKSLKDFYSFLEQHYITIKTLIEIHLSSISSKSQELFITYYSSIINTTLAEITLLANIGEDYSKSTEIELEQYCNPIMFEYDKIFLMPEGLSATERENWKSNWDKMRETPNDRKVFNSLMCCLSKLYCTKTINFIKELSLNYFDESLELTSYSLKTKRGNDTLPIISLLKRPLKSSNKKQKEISDLNKCRLTENELSEIYKLLAANHTPFLENDIASERENLTSILKQTNEPNITVVIKDNSISLFHYFLYFVFGDMHFNEKVITKDFIIKHKVSDKRTKESISDFFNKTQSLISGRDKSIMKYNNWATNFCRVTKRQVYPNDEALKRIAKFWETLHFNN